jgi:hypothetical protein
VNESENQENDSKNKVNESENHLLYNGKCRYRAGNPYLSVTDAAVLRVAPGGCQASAAPTCHQSLHTPLHLKAIATETMESLLNMEVLMCV